MDLVLRIAFYHLYNGQKIIEANQIYEYLL